MNKIITHPKYGPIRIVKDLGVINHRRRVEVEFINTGYTMETRYDTFLGGKLQDEWYGIDFNKEYPTNSYGPVKILEYVGRGNDHRVMVKCQFLNSGTIAVLELRRLLKGLVRDPNLGFDLNRLYNSNSSGPFRVIEIINGTKEIGVKCLIEFVLTGYRKLVSPQNIPTGEVKDDTQFKNIPIDKSLIENYDEWVNTRLRSIWTSMVTRCTDPNSSTFKGYGAIGVKVDDSWLDLNTFINDARSLPQFEKYYDNPTKYQLDKDYLQRDIPRSNRIYSKQTCMFLYYLDNSNMRAIDYLKENYDTISSKYFGVVKVKNLYKASIMLDGNARHIGSFTDEIMAAAAFNYFERKYHPYELIPLFNDVPDISPTEFVKYNVSAKLMYRLINNQ